MIKKNDLLSKIILIAAKTYDESLEVFDIIKPGRRVKIKRSQAVKCQKLLTIRYSPPPLPHCDKNSC